MTILSLVCLMAIGGYGAATILIDSQLFAPLHSLLEDLVWATRRVRTLHKVFTGLQYATQCYMCVGFWCGAGFAFWSGLLLNEIALSGAVCSVLSEHLHARCTKDGTC